MNNLELKKIRKELRLTQEKLAKELNVSKSLVQKWESGERTPDDFIISLIRKIHKNAQKDSINETEINIVNENSASYSPIEEKIKIAEQRIKELENKLKTNDPDMTERAISMIKSIIEKLYDEIDILQEAKNDRLKIDLEK